MDILRLIWLEFETGLLSPWLIAFFFFAMAALCLFLIFFSIWNESSTYRKVLAQSTVVVPPQPVDFTSSLVTALIAVAVVAGVILLFVKDFLR
jgi:hypothetical protein